MPEMSAELRAERRVREDVFVTKFLWLFGAENGIRPQTPLCRECDELRLGVPGLCLGEAGVGAVLVH
jgi:hypothetical protein